MILKQYLFSHYFLLSLLVKTKLHIPYTIPYTLPYTLPYTITHTYSHLYFPNRNFVKSSKDSVSLFTSSFIPK